MTPERRERLAAAGRRGGEILRADRGNTRAAPLPAAAALADPQRALLMRLFGADWQRAEARMASLAARNELTGGVRHPGGE